MTYGWVILIIAIVVGVLVALGLFNGYAATPNGCFPQQGFTCSNLVYTSNGITATISQDSGQNYYDALVFVASEDENIGSGGLPVNFSESNTVNMTPIGTIPPSGTVTFNFNHTSAGDIPTAKIPVGTEFTGYIWIAYCLSPVCSGPTAYSKVATIATKYTGSLGFSGQSAALPTPVLDIAPGYIPITLDQGGNQINYMFQQNVTFSPSQYNSHESPDLGNIRFYAGAPSISNALTSWCQSGCTNDSSNAEFWIKMPTGETPGEQIYMYFEPNTTYEYDGVYAGEAPQLSSTYAQYDNGQSIFDFYDNFAGQYTYSNDSGTTTGTPVPGFFAVNAVAAVDNGLVLSNATGAANTSGMLFATTSKYGVGTTFDAEVVGLPYSDTVNIGYQELPYNPGPSPQYGTFIRQACGSTYPDQINYSGEPNGCGSIERFASSENLPGVYSVAITSSKESYQQLNGSGMLYQPADTSFPEPPESPGSYPTYVGFSSSHGGIILPVQWVRIRNAPPLISGVPQMPSATLGNFVPT